MKRRDFLISSCSACLSVSALSGALSSCRSTKYIPGKLNNDGIMIETDEFKTTRNGTTSYYPYIVVRNEDLKFPICVYRFNAQEYSALWMQCTHQGAEVQVAGSSLQCPAHGSEYDNKGHVTSGPATRGLRAFPVSVVNNQIFIDLRKK